MGERDPGKWRTSTGFIGDRIGSPLKWGKGIEWTKVISDGRKGFEIKRIWEE